MSSASRDAVFGVLAPALAEICSPATIRARTALVYQHALAGGTAFRVDESKLPACVDLVLEVTRRNYPGGDIPVHGRYEHFRAGGVDRIALLREKLRGVPPRDRAKALVDVTLISVLLDAGAGNAWKYVESGKSYTRSEGLAVASVAMFVDGAFSSAGASDPLRADGAALSRITAGTVGRGFQVTDSNPLAGLEGRSSLLARLSESMAAHPRIFGSQAQRPGNIIDALEKVAVNGAVRAADVLLLLLIGLSKMWPPRAVIEGVGFGDVWSYEGINDGPLLVPFHKLSQWLAYSLMEPIEEAGLKVIGVGELTGLPEYRNGGLFLDTGVLALRDPRLAARELEAGEQAIIEWRALTVQLLDRVWGEVCRKLARTKEELPLARVLQGGTWSAGREIAARLRPGGVPPLTLKSDGMVF